MIKAERVASHKKKLYRVPRVFFRTLSEMLLLLLFILL